MQTPSCVLDTLELSCGNSTTPTRVREAKDTVVNWFCPNGGNGPSLETLPKPDAQKRPISHTTFHVILTRATFDQEWHRLSWIECFQLTEAESGRSSVWRNWRHASLIVRSKQLCVVHCETLQTKLELLQGPRFSADRNRTMAAAVRTATEMCKYIETPAENCNACGENVHRNNQCCYLNWYLVPNIRGYSALSSCSPKTWTSIQWLSVKAKRHPQHVILSHDNVKPDTWSHHVKGVLGQEGSPMPTTTTHTWLQKAVLAYNRARPKKWWHFFLLYVYRIVESDDDVRFEVGESKDA